MREVEGSEVYQLNRPHARGVKRETLTNPLLFPAARVRAAALQLLGELSGDGVQ